MHDRDRPTNKPSASPQIGRPRSLGQSEDLADAAGLLAVFRVVRDALQRRPPSLPNHLAREALWDLWELPRLPPPLVSSKYPKSYPWSAAARSAYNAAGGKRPPGGWGFVFEHVTPRSILRHDLVLRSPELSPKDVVSVLADGLCAAVVTKADNKLLEAAGLAKSHPEGADPRGDPWSRYRAAGFDLATFKPLEPIV